MMENLQQVLQESAEYGKHRTDRSGAAMSSSGRLSAEMMMMTGASKLG